MEHDFSSEKNHETQKTVDFNALLEDARTDENKEREHSGKDWAFGPRVPFDSLCSHKLALSRGAYNR